jgi:hypothetical protein
MKTSVLAAIAVALSLPCVSFASVAAAQPDYHWRGGPDQRDWDPSRSYDGRRHHDRRLGRNDYVYRGGDGRYYCRRNDGTTGLVVGGIAGGVLGNAIGGDTLGTLLGAASGAVVGRSIDRGKVHCR